MILIIYPLGFYKSIVFQCLTLFWDIIMTTYIRKRHYLELVAKNLLNLTKLIQVVCGKYYFHLFSFNLLDFNLHLVESFTVYSDNARLRYEGVRVNHFDESEHVYALVLLCQNTEHFHFLTSIPSVSIQNGNTMPHLSTNSISYLLPFARENKELYRLSASIHHIVEYIVLHRHHTESEHHLMCSLYVCTKLREEHTRANDTEVGCYKYRTKRYVVILVY